MATASPAIGTAAAAARGGAAAAVDDSVAAVEKPKSGTPSGDVFTAPPLAPRASGEEAAASAEVRAVARALSVDALASVGARFCTGTALSVSVCAGGDAPLASAGALAGLPAGANAFLAPSSFALVVFAVVILMGLVTGET